MTKIDIVSGFLGAGKTTLIKKMVKEAYQGEKLVLIENEFGEISIDGGFLKDAGIQISEMSSGCICCSLVGDFGKALREVKEQFQPDRILIEPSGVGKLSDVIVAVENTVADIPDMKLNSFVTVADAGKVKVYMKNFGEFYNNQIESAGPIILSRTQKLPQEQLDLVLPETEILVMALPSVADTVGILSRERIALLPRDAIVVNVGRGTAIDQEALMEALNAGRIAGAALDVVVPEPLPREHPLWSTRNLLLTPHISGNMSLGYTCDINVDMFCRDLENYAAGRPLEHRVDRKRGY